MRLLRPLVLPFLVPLLASCQNASVTVGAQSSFSFDVSAATTEYQAGGTLWSNGAVPSFPCASQAVCDALAASQDVTLSCTEGVCDPDPIEVSYATDVVDFGEIAASVASLVTRVQLVGASYEVTSNTLNTSLAPVEVFWGPEGASDLASPGVTRLATLPSIAAMSTPAGEIVLHDAGNDALSDYLADTSMRVRFFLRTEVDLEPGQAAPAGAFMARLHLRIRLSGQIR